MEKNQQAINIFLESPEGNPKTANAVPDLTATDLNTDQGMNFFEKLDKVFQSETTDESYGMYPAFISFKRTYRMNMSDFILEYKHLYQKMIQYDIKLPDAIIKGWNQYWNVYLCHIQCMTNMTIYKLYKTKHFIDKNKINMTRKVIKKKVIKNQILN